MKAFDLEKALAGEPVVLRNGSKGYVTADYSKFFPFNTFLYQGVFQIGKSKTQFERNSWTIDGSSFFEHNKYPHLENPFDIVGMWEEPRPTVTLTLPCPLKAVMVGQKVFYLDLNKQHEQVCSFLFQTDSTYHFNLLKNGGIFSTEEDAQAWLDAMRDTRR
ncbi:pyruvate kinase [Pasteurella multocida]|nr:pyruvate kinase [Pasteurella multocida]